MDFAWWILFVAAVLGVWLLLVGLLVFAGRSILARELVTLLPNLVRLFAGLLRDHRVPLRAKVVLAAASAYVAFPIDLIPEFIPVVGPLDDAIVSALALRFVLRTTDPATLREHWRGDPRTLDRLLRLAGRPPPPPPI